MVNTAVHQSFEYSCGNKIVCCFVLEFFFCIFEMMKTHMYKQSDLFGVYINISRTWYTAEPKLMLLHLLLYYRLHVFCLSRVWHLTFRNILCGLLISEHKTKSFETQRSDCSLNDLNICMESTILCIFWVLMEETAKSIDYII